MLDDLPRIVEIYNSYVPGFTVTADTEPVSVESRLAWFERHDPHKRPLWVATSGDAIAGWLGFQPFYDRSAYDATAEISVYVAQEFRRQGIARALMTKALDEGPRLGLKTLIGLAFAVNEPSLTMLRSFGFEQWGLLPGATELAGVERDVAIMGRKL